MERYENLQIWQRAYALALRIYCETKTFPKEELYGLVSQMRRAAVSIPANIAEGSQRTSKKEFLHFLHISLGSLGELGTFIRLSKDLDYFNVNVFDGLILESRELSKMINAFTGAEKKKTVVAL